MANDSCQNLALKASMAGESSGSRNRPWKGMMLQVGEVEKISKRLEILEEDMKAMKRALFEALEESRNLVSEMKQQFQSMKNSSNEGGFVGFEDHEEMFNRLKERRSEGGLSEIFEFEEHPKFGLVIKDLKPNVLALEQSAKAPLWLSANNQYHSS